jgi:hypothetical protein
MLPAAMDKRIVMTINLLAKRWPKPNMLYPLTGHDRMFNDGLVRRAQFHVSGAA